MYRDFLEITFNKNDLMTFWTKYYTIIYFCLDTISRLNIKNQTALPSDKTVLNIGKRFDRNAKTYTSLSIKNR